MLKINNLNVFFGGIHALKGISFDVPKGKVITLIGANGAGKSTTLRTICGLIKPQEGKIKFNDKEITGAPTDQIVKRGIALIPEGRKIFPEMTVVENLRMGCFHEDRKEVIRLRMEAIFQLFPRLKEREQQLGGTLSGGEQGMLAIGRAMMGEPRLMILDEPSLGLQPNLVELMFEIIQRINQERNTTILLAEQNAKRTLEIADSGYVLQKGRIIAQGTAAEIAGNEVVKQAYLKADSSLINQETKTDKG